MMQHDRPCHFVDTDEAFATLLTRLEGVPALALDTESNSFHAYFEKVCLLQISTEEEDWAVDSLKVDLRPFGRLLADPKVELVLHAADFDIRSLKRDFGVRFAGLFDTMLAAKTLGYPEIGLAALVRRHFGISLAKAHQRSDWGRRPLSPGQLEYAFKDTRFLLPLRTLLRAELQAAGRLAEAQRLFARQATCEPRKKRFDAEGFRRVRGFAGLPEAQRPAVRALYLLREQCARLSDRPPFKIFGDEAILELARNPPHDEQGLLAVRGIGEQTVRRHGREILAAVGAAGPGRHAAA